MTSTQHSSSLTGEELPADVWLLCQLSDTPKKGGHAGRFKEEKLWWQQVLLQQSLPSQELHGTAAVKKNMKKLIFQSQKLFKGL